MRYVAPSVSSRSPYGGVGHVLPSHLPGAGPIPSDLGRLTALEVLLLWDNKLTGERTLRLLRYEGIAHV